MVIDYNVFATNDLNSDKDAFDQDFTVKREALKKVNELKKLQYEYITIDGRDHVANCVLSIEWSRCKNWDRVSQHLDTCGCIENGTKAYFGYHKDIHKS